MSAILLAQCSDTICIVCDYSLSVISKLIMNKHSMTYWNCVFTSTDPTTMVSRGGDVGRNDHDDLRRRDWSHIKTVVRFVAWILCGILLHPVNIKHTHW